MLTLALADIPTLATTVLDSSEPISPADTHGSTGSHTSDLLEVAVPQGYTPAFPVLEGR